VYILNTKYRFDFKKLKTPNQIVIHNTGRIPLTVEQYYDNCVQEVGQPKTHFIITRKGTIYQTLPLNIMGNHITKKNESSFGVSLHNVIGIESQTRSSKSITPALKYSLNKLLNILKDEFYIADANVKTHKEFMVLDMKDFMIESGLMLGKIDLDRFLVFNGKELEDYKKSIIDMINEEVEQSLYKSMLIDKIKNIPDCPGINYDDLMRYSEL